MNLAHYFENAEGSGILATCDPAGDVDQAIYSKPYVIDDQTIVFIMKSRLSRQNLKSHLKASYLFLEKSPEYKGIRLYLTMKHEEKSQDLLNTMRKSQPDLYSDGDDSDKYAVFFEVNRIRSLIGNKTLI